MDVRRRLAILAFLLAGFSVLLVSASSCNKVTAENEDIFVTPEPQNSPQEIEKRILDSSKAPLLSAAHISEDITLCFKCHPEAELKTNDANLIFSHQRHFAQGLVCHTCHKDEGAMVYIPVKEDCIACHTDRNIPTSCKTCHKDTEVLKPESHHLTGFKTVHGKSGLDLKSCAECHGKTRFCYDCHGVQMPHPDDFVRIHPSHVLGDPQRCTLCHGKQPCMSCHTSRGVRFN